MAQQAYNPIDYHFKWTDDGWYEWNSVAAHKAARQARDAAARALQRSGHQVHKFTLRNYPRIA